MQGISPIELYLKHLRPNGVMLFHISNVHLTLAPIVGRLAEEHRLVAFVNVDRRTPEWPASRRESIWVAMAKQLEDLGPISADPRWRAIDIPPSTPLWTDDFSDILGAVGALGRKDGPILTWPGNRRNFAPHVSRRSHEAAGRTTAYRSAMDNTGGAMALRCRWLWAFAAALLLATPTLGQEYRGRVQGSSQR